MWSLLHLLSPHQWFCVTNAEADPDPVAHPPDPVAHPVNMDAVAQLTKHTGLPKSDLRALFWDFVDTPIDDDDVVSRTLYIEYLCEDRPMYVKVLKLGPGHSEVSRLGTRAVLVTSNDFYIGRVHESVLDGLETWVVYGVNVAVYPKASVVYDAEAARTCTRRTSLFKQELIERTWHPSRLKHCLDTEEARELLDL